MSDESLESDETSIYNIIGFKEKEGEEKEEGNSEFKGGRRAIWGLPPPSESDKDSKEETFETPEKEIRKPEGQKGIETKRKMGRPRKDSKVTSSIRKHPIVEKDLLRMLIDEVSRNRVEMEEMQERIERRDREVEEVKQKMAELEERMEKTWRRGGNKRGK